ncbi:uncharacterized protein LOC131314371 [Rhododendron vialii]|uniref:uncharacterized protein LOC131314371 n=1 Tax=Rhododendron vialii TaxID=182163 RepID=UPI00265F570F|nr:uncharacterized protein LOC131314371 [Rhododendron vialii]
MARILHNLFTIVLLSLLSVRLSLSSDPPLTAPSPAPAPEHGADSLSAPEYNSPPAPPPDDLEEFPADSPSTGSPSPSPSSSPSPSPSPLAESPSPVYKGEMSADAEAEAEEEGEKGEGSGGTKGGKKAGIVFGVVAAACVVGFGGVVYKKRQQNIRRAQYGYAARSDFL